MASRNMVRLAAALCLSLTAAAAADHDQVRRFWAASDPRVSWLSALSEPAVLHELQALADRDMLVSGGGSGGSAFRADFGPNSDLAGVAGGWTALELLNKGAPSAAGCRAAPHTCAVLDRLAGHLVPRPGAEQVGVRLLKLEAGATIRPHVGPGGRLVAHLGLRVPPAGAAALTVAGERMPWREGDFLIFDDSLPHSAENTGDHARYVLHVAFPTPAAVVLSVSTPGAALLQDAPPSDPSDPSESPPSPPSPRSSFLFLQ